MAVLFRFGVHKLTHNCPLCPKVFNTIIGKRSTVASHQQLFSHMRDAHNTRINIACHTNCIGHIEQHG